jgi:hypothetical protein
MVICVLQDPTSEVKLLREKLDSEWINDTVTETWLADSTHILIELDGLKNEIRIVVFCIHTVLKPRRSQCEFSPPWKFQIKNEMYVAC